MLGSFQFRTLFSSINSLSEFEFFSHWRRRSSPLTFFSSNSSLFLNAPLFNSSSTSSGSCPSLTVDQFVSPLWTDPSLSFHMGSATEEQYTKFEEKVKRTVYVDNLSPQVTEAVLRTALDQFGTVVNIHFIPNFAEPINTSQCALVEMKDLKEATSVISVIDQFPFMMSGMPRPVRARPAEVEMFDDRPVKPGRKIKCVWLGKDDPDFEVAKKMKRLAQKHVAEAAFLLKQQLVEEEKLAKQQQEGLKGNYKKYEIVDSVMADGTARRLARRYNMRVADD